MSPYRHGRHELGQNFLTNRRIIDDVVGLVEPTSGPIIEIGAGDGALTLPLGRLGRPIAAIELDAHLAATLRRRCGPGVTVEQADFLRYRLPLTPHVLVGNLPFHQTTAMLRRILHAPGWTDAVLLVQWEVARRRAGVGRATMMTAQWSPWFTFTLAGRVPASAFTPRPGVDGGLFTIVRDAAPALPESERRGFQALVHRVYTGRGRGLAQILAASTALASAPAAASWLARHGFRGTDLPGDLTTHAWIDLYRTTGVSPPPAPRRRPRPRARRGGNLEP